MERTFTFSTFGGERGNNHFIKSVFIFLITTIGIMSNVLSQVAPFTVSRDWYFGQGGRLTFPTGSFPVAAAPAAGSMPTNTSTAIENSTGVCFSNGNIAFYTNTMQAYNANPAHISWDVTPMRNFSTDMTCAGSSTGGGVAFPDPQSPTNAFYLIIANDMTGGGCENQGVNRYRFTGTGTTVAYNAGPDDVEAPGGGFASEAIAVATDGIGGYWLILHDRAATNRFRVWHYATTGISGPTDYTIGADVANTTNSQSYLKVSPCQNRIAYHSGGTIVVHDFNRTTGAVGTERRRLAVANYGIGLEFSPDGGTLYYSGQGDAINYVIIASGATGTIGGGSWSMQIGPDGKIYTSPGGTSIGVISTPNAGGGTYSTLALPGGASTFRGLNNLAWMTPELPIINRTITDCNVDFTHRFRNYYQTNVGVNAGTFSWNFGDSQSSTAVAPSHTYATDGTYTVTVSFNDQFCGQTWTATTNVTVTCTLPVEWLDFDANYNAGKVYLNWSTASESGNSNFSIQRSQDGYSFETIGTLDSKGNTNSVQEYAFTDSAPIAGGSFYRIVQHDIDGKQTSSPSEYVVADEVVVNVSPNPSGSTFKISLSGTASSDISIVDMMGKLVYEGTVSGVETIVGGELEAGTYVLQAQTPNGLYTTKLVKN